MADNLMKRFVFVVAYLVGSAILIHLMMETDPGYRGNWLYVLTGHVVWFVLLIFKIALCGAGLWIAVHLIHVAQQMNAQVRNEREEQEQQRLVKQRNVREQSVYRAEMQARESAQIERLEKEKRDHEEWRRKVEFERSGPRNEKAAIEKALSEIKFGGFE